jgi:tripartite-type tricarboxylate transporter receptor subunit TctC
MRSRRAFLATVAALVAARRTAAQAPFPARPIRLLVGQAPGGQTDTIARAVAHLWSERWRDGVVVENQAGASGAIAARSVAQAPPDGYALLLGSSASLVLATVTGEAGYDPLRDFTPIGRVARVSYALVARGGLGAAKLDEFVALARRRPGALTLATVGTGSNVAVLATRFARAAGIDVLQVPYKGGAPSVQALLVGEVDATICDLSAVTAHAAAGAMRILAVVGAQRSPLAPEVPTLGEAGYADVGDDPWYALVGPAGLPAPVIDALTAMLRATVRDNELRRRFAALGYTLFEDTPDAFTRALALELAQTRATLAARERR